MPLTSFIHYEIKAIQHVPVGDKVAVIGLGMTAIDAATQAKRLGASEVTIVYRRTHAEMPCTQHEMDIALLDGCKIKWLSAPKEIIGHKTWKSNRSCLQCNGTWNSRCIRSPLTC